MGGKLSNCPRCEKLFVSGIHDVCPACVKEIDQEYLRCINYLKENGDVTIEELSNGTDVSVRQIAKFIFERRILTRDFPNLGVPCESCGKTTKSGRVCESCRESLKKSIEVLEEEKRKDMGLGYRSKQQ